MPNGKHKHNSRRLATHQAIDVRNAPLVYHIARWQLVTVLIEVVTITD